MSITPSYTGLIGKFTQTITPVSVTIEDTYANITGSGFIDGVGGNNYFIQKLVPGVQYKLSFDIYKKETNSDGIEEFVSKIYNLRPSAVHNGIGDTIVSDDFFRDADNDIAFLTTNNFNTLTPDIVLGTNGFPRNDTSPFLPRVGDSKITIFTSSARRYTTILPNGLPPSSGAAAIPTSHSYDAFMMIFPHQNVVGVTLVEDTNSALTEAFYNGQYLNASMDNSVVMNNGILHMFDVHYIETDPAITELPLSNFISASNLQIKYGSLVKDGLYIVAFMLYDKHSDYIPYYNDSSIIGRPKQIKWYRFVMQAAGNWEIFLSSFNPVSNSYLHSSTAVSINIDGMSTVGTPSTDDFYKLIIRATPY